VDFVTVYRQMTSLSYAFTQWETSHNG
jgi:hypothetical protein